MLYHLSKVPHTYGILICHVIHIDNFYHTNFFYSARGCFMTCRTRVIDYFKCKTRGEGDRS